MNSNYAKRYASKSIIKRKVFYSIVAGDYESNPRNFRDKDCKKNSSLFTKNSLSSNESIRKFRPLLKLYDRADIINDIA